MTIKGYFLFKMSYKELKDTKDTKETEQPKNCVAYVEILSTLIIVGMFCATALAVQKMWIQEQHDEMIFLRGATP